jgi:hypothetical protein
LPICFYVYFGFPFDRAEAADFTLDDSKV